MKNFITIKELDKILAKYQNIFFDDKEDYLIVKQEISQGTDEKYHLVFGFGDNYQDGSSQVEYYQELNPNNIIADLDKWINHYQINNLDGSYLTEASILAIDIVDQDDECLYVLGWDSVKEYQAKKTKYFKQQEINNERQ